MIEKASAPIHLAVQLGHLHLKVADWERAIHFYQGELAMFTKPLDLDSLLKTAPPHPSRSRDEN